MSGIDGSDSRSLHKHGEAQFNGCNLTYDPDKPNTLDHLYFSWYIFSSIAHFESSSLKTVPKIVNLTDGFGLLSNESGKCNEVNMLKLS